MNHSKQSPVRSFQRQVKAIFLLSMLSSAFSSAHAELLLTSPPRESAAAGIKQYGPIAERLSEVLGEKVTYKQSKGWLFYQRDMRADKFDIIFDGPHFISWRIKQFNHRAVAKVPGTLGFIVIANKGTYGAYRKEIGSLDDLINVPVCSLAPPNLSSMTVLAEYKNPVSMPKLITVKGGMKGVYKAFKNGKCKAAILRDKFYDKKVPEADRADLKVIFKSIPVVNQGFSVSSRVTDEQIVKIKTALTEVDDATAPLLKRFAPKANKMLPVESDDYKNFYKLLTGVVFGWEIDETLVKEK